MVTVRCSPHKRITNGTHHRIQLSPDPSPDCFSTNKGLSVTMQDCCAGWVAEVKLQSSGTLEIKHNRLAKNPCLFFSKKHIQLEERPQASLLTCASTEPHYYFTGLTRGCGKRRQICAPKPEPVHGHYQEASSSSRNLVSRPRKGRPEMALRCSGSAFHVIFQPNTFIRSKEKQRKTRVEKSAILRTHTKVSNYSSINCSRAH